MQAAPLMGLHIHQKGDGGARQGDELSFEANVGAVLARLVVVSMRLETTTAPGQPNACEAKLVPAAMVGQTRDNTRAISHRVVCKGGS